MALDVKFLTGSQADYSALKEAELIEDKTFYYITDADTKKLYLGGQELTNDGSVQEVYDILGISENITDDNKISIDGKTYDSIINYINEKTSGLPTQDNIESKIEKVVGSTVDVIPVFDGKGGLKEVSKNVTIDTNGKLSANTVSANTIETLGKTIKSGTSDESVTYYMPNNSTTTNANSTNTLATQAYVTEQVASGAVQYLGALSFQAQFLSYDNTLVSKGDFFRVATAVKLPINDNVKDDIQCYAGDLIIAEKDYSISDPLIQKIDGINWSLIQSHDTDTTYKADGTTLTLNTETNIFSVADKGIGTNQLADGAVTKEKIAKSAITNEKIQIGTIEESSLNEKVVEKFTNKIESIVFDGQEITPTDKTITLDSAVKGIVLQPSSELKDNINSWPSNGSVTIKITEGTENGTIAIGNGAKSANVKVHGLGSAAFKNEDDFLNKDNITSGNTAGTIKVKDTEIKVAGFKTIEEINAQTSATINNAIGIQDINKPTGVYETIQGKTTTTIKECEDKISLLQGNTTATVADCVKALNVMNDENEKNTEATITLTKNINNVSRQLQWNEMPYLQKVLTNDGGGQYITFLVIPGISWEACVEKFSENSYYSPISIDGDNVLINDNGSSYTLHPHDQQSGLIYKTEIIQTKEILENKEYYGNYYASK